MTPEFVVGGIGGITPGGVIAFGRVESHGDPAWPRGFLPEFAYKSITHIGAGRARRLDRYSSLGLAAIALCLQDARQLIDPQADPQVTPDAFPVTGVVAASRYGCLATDVDYFNTLKGEVPTSAPNLFAYTLPGSFLGEAAISFALCGPTLVLADPLNEELAVVASACDLLITGQSEAMLCGWCDLEAPAMFPASAAANAPGAFFLYLAPAQSNLPKTYGRLLLNADGGFTLEGRPVDDRNALIKACLTVFSDPP